MRATFIVSSAIHTKHGVFSTNERFAQSLQTVASIRRFAPDAQIIWVEMAAIALSPEEKAYLLAHCVDYLIEYAGNEQVQHYYRHIEDHNALKNLTELSCFYWALQTAQERGWLAQSERIFKLSGRYNLVEPFDLALYEHADFAGHYGVSRRFLSQFSPALTGDVGFQYMSRLWSFDAALLPEVLQLLPQMVQRMHVCLNAGGYIDIEHLLYAFLPAEKTLELTTLGVSGQLGPNGERVID